MAPGSIPRIIKIISTGSFNRLKINQTDNEGEFTREGELAQKGEVALPRLLFYFCLILAKILGLTALSLKQDLTKVRFFAIIES